MKADSSRLTRANCRLRPGPSSIRTISREWTRRSRFTLGARWTLIARLRTKGQYAYPRQAVSRRLAEYNAGLGADARAGANIEALADPDTYCVITGQQAGFMGGPAYTAYKIITAIRLAEHLAKTWGTRVVPVFWLASEDHDFEEINHTYLIKRDGEIGRVRFSWRQQGRPDL